MTMTNLAMINEVEERINKADNLVMFPVQFTESKKKFSELDDAYALRDELNAKIARLEVEANDTMMEEYMENEGYRLAHEFLSTIYEDIDRMKTMQIGDGLIKSLKYGNSKAIQDHEGRWFKTITDACKYHGVSLNTFRYRRRAGYSLAECFSPEEKKRGRKGRD